MQAPCSHCGTLHALNDAQTGGHPRVQFRCSRCGKNTIVKTRGVDSTASALAAAGFCAERRRARRRGPVRDRTRRAFSCRPTKSSLCRSSRARPRARLYRSKNPWSFLGRSGADFTIGDPNISRQHCAVEVRGDAVRVRDLDSTNGTFVGLERVRAAELRHLSEFRMGLSVVLVTITPKLPPPSLNPGLSESGAGDLCYRSAEPDDAADQRSSHHLQRRKRPAARAGIARGRRGRTRRGGFGKHRPHLRDRARGGRARPAPALRPIRHSKRISPPRKPRTIGCWRWTPTKH